MGAPTRTDQRTAVTSVAFETCVAKRRRGHPDWSRYPRLQSAPSVGSRLAGLHHLPQHVLQDAAVAEVFELVERVDPAEQLDLVDLAVGAMDAASELAARLQALRHAEDVVALGAIELEALPRHTLFELQRQHTHAHQVRAVDALEALDDHRLDA